ncbi:PQ loop repeat family protein [Tritrichomonas foetus]|uniref:PQ loop repeat family protein n=1 Tax=Tritrichomonas foetus TaxID=1144522 RepID=A0A1J4KRJ5_9EUKA|nr:PQ loop repeat family protein [Tritrichomonas foetus]|eukprot:OHT12436.1 PQ loop repeat family protein [Tritrichomonas foetus]
MSNSDECKGGIEWINKVFGDCVVTPRDKISFSIGMISNILWLVCSSPQIYHNFKTKHVDGFSPFYFIFIVSADLFSLLGAIFTHALASQIVTGFIYISLDIILLSQFGMYSDKSSCCKRQKKFDTASTISQICDDDSDDNDTHRNEDLPKGPIFAVLPALAASKIDYSIPYKGEYLFGSVSGWVGTTIYITSRVFQLIKNLEQEIVRDFSIVYVAILITANATYSISVFIRSLDEAYLWKQTPFIIGSLVPMTFDCITMGQVIYGRYKMRKQPIYENVD